MQVESVANIHILVLEDDPESITLIQSALGRARGRRAA